MCGRALASSPEPSAALPICGSCAPESIGADALVVRTLAGTVSLDEASVLERLRSGQLQGRDWLEEEGGASVPLAAHPAIARRYLRGEIPQPVARAHAPPPKKKKSAARSRPPLPIGRILRGAAGLALAGGMVAGVLSVRDQIPGWADQAGRVLAPAADTPELPPAAVLAPGEPPPDPLASIRTAEGVVEEPLAYLTARAMEAWAHGGPAGRAEALGIARRGVARATTDADAVALLAVLAALSRDQPGLTLLAGQQAVALGGAGVASELGRAALALNNNDPTEAVGSLRDCLAAGDLVCRLVAADALAGIPGRQAESLAAYDGLAAAWPEHLDPPRTAALIAATADDPSAEGRLAALSATDPIVAGARGVLEARNGRMTEAARIAVSLGSEAPAELAVTVARDRVQAGEPAEALALLAPLDVEKPPRNPRSVEVRLLVAQARWVAARDNPAALPEARVAVERLVELDRTDPAVSQVRALVAHMAGDRAEEARAWSSLNENARTGPDLARVYKTQLALLNDAKLPGNDLLPLAEKARLADPSDPNVHVWLVEVHLIGHNHGAAIEALKRSIGEVDGQMARRRTDLVALETGAPAKTLRAHLDDALGNEGRFATALPLARATASWLAGDQAGARTALGQAANLDTDADALAFRARLYEGLKDYPRAVKDWDQVAALRPKDSEFLLAALRSHVLAGQLGTATALAELVRASKVNPALGPAMLAEIRLAGGDRAGAVDLLTRAVAADPLDLVSRARLRELRKGG